MTVLKNYGALNAVIYSKQELIDAIEDNSIYLEFQNTDIDIDLFKNADLRHEQLKDTLDLLKKVEQQK